MSAFTAFIIGLVLGFTIVGLTFWMMYRGDDDDFPEDNEENEI